jgi:hypothetical protein
MNQNSSNAELDLFYTLKEIWHIGKRMLKTIYVFCFTKWLWFAAAIALALAASAAIYRYNISNKYSAVVLRPNCMTAGAAINFVNYHLATNHDRSGLQHILNLPDTLFDCIRKISAHRGIDINGDGVMDKIEMNTNSDTTLYRRLVSDRFYVCIRWQNMPKNYEQHAQYLRQITDALIAMFENDQQVKQQNAARITQSRAWIKEMKMLDSLQKLTFFNKVRTSDDNLMLRSMLAGEKAISHSDISEMANLIEQRLKLEQELALYGTAVSFVGYIQESVVSSSNDFADILWHALFIAIGAALIAAMIWDKHKIVMNEYYCPHASFSLPP